MKLITSKLITLLFFTFVFLSNCKKISPTEYYFSEVGTQHLSSEQGIPSPTNSSEIRKESYGIRVFLSRELDRSGVNSEEDYYLNPLDSITIYSTNSLGISTPSNSLVSNRFRFLKDIWETTYLNSIPFESSQPNLSKSETNVKLDFILVDPPLDSVSTRFIIKAHFRDSINPIIIDTTTLILLK